MHKQQKTSYIALFSRKKLDTVTDCEVLTLESKLNSHPAFRGRDEMMDIEIWLEHLLE